MPELPDVVVYIEAIERRVIGRRLERVRLSSPFLLRTVDPPIAAAAFCGAGRVGSTGGAAASAAAIPAAASVVITVARVAPLIASLL